MAKNIVFIAKSLDGFIAGKNGELNWLNAVPNPDNNDMGYNDFMNEIDAVVLGRITYETVLGFGGDWPYSKPVFVLSYSLKEVPAELENKVTLLCGSESEILDQIHALGYSALYIDGGTVIQNFLKADLIDELIITTMPILLGGGFPLFSNLFTPIPLKHLKTKVFLDAIVQSHYLREK